MKSESQIRAMLESHLRSTAARDLNLTFVRQQATISILEWVLDLEDYDTEENGRQNRECADALKIPS
jgi:hypothetical protein